MLSECRASDFVLAFVFMLQSCGEQLCLPTMVDCSFLVPTIHSADLQCWMMESSCMRDCVTFAKPYLLACLCLPWFLHLEFHACCCLLRPPYIVASSHMLQKGRVVFKPLPARSPPTWTRACGRIGSMPASATCCRTHGVLTVR